MFLLDRLAVWSAFPVDYSLTVSSGLHKVLEEPVQFVKTERVELVQSLIGRGEGQGAGLMGEGLLGGGEGAQL